MVGNGPGRRFPNSSLWLPTAKMRCYVRPLRQHPPGGSPSFATWEGGAFHFLCPLVLTAGSWPHSSCISVSDAIRSNLLRSSSGLAKSHRPGDNEGLQQGRGGLAGVGC